MRHLSDIERATVYATIRTLIQDLEEMNETLIKNGDGYVGEKLRELTWHAQSLAHLDDGNNHSDEQHWVWLLGALHKVKGATLMAK
jgi:hypothetical protein